MLFDFISMKEVKIGIEYIISKKIQISNIGDVTVWSAYTLYSLHHDSRDVLVSPKGMLELNYSCVIRYAIEFYKLIQPKRLN